MWQVAHPERVIPAEQLRKGLLDERHPELTGNAASCVYRRAFLVARQPVVDRERHPRLTHKELQRENAVPPAAHGEKEAVELARPARGEGCERTHQPAIVRTLARHQAHASGRHAIRRKDDGRFVNLGRAEPLLTGDGLLQWVRPEMRVLP